MTPSNDSLAQLEALGTSVWLDDISRERLASGNLQQLIDQRHVVGVTSNPSIFEKAMEKGSAYDAQLRDLAVRGVSTEEAVRLLTAYDIRWACDVLRPVYERTGGRDGRVSLEVDPRIAKDTEKTTAEAEALWWLVDRPNLMIKIPATEAGIDAIAASIGKGISVNVTLIFAIERYRRVLGAYLDGLERAQRGGIDLSTIHSVGSFFVSRVDTEVDKRLEKLGTPEAHRLRSRAAIANARLAYQAFQQTFVGPRWEALKASGAHVQRPLWASTSVKDPSLDDTLYVKELVAADTVNTMPESTLEAFADHGVVSGDTAAHGYQHAQDLIAELAGLGIEMDDVTQVLETEGVAKFQDAWQQLLDGVTRQLQGKA